MNKQERMQERMEKHGMQLKKLFGIEDISAVELSKKIRRIEKKAHRLATAHCNGLVDTDDYELLIDKLLDAVDKLLNYRHSGIPVFINSDPRGYALKIDDEYVRTHKLDIHRDWGGYGILAPDFSEDRRMK